MTNDFAILKERVSLADYIVSHKGGTIEPQGKSLDITPCPFCGHSNCFKVTPEEQSFHCYRAGCNHGDIFDFIEYHNNCDKAKALRILAKEQNYELTGQFSDKVKRSSEEEKAISDLVAIFEAAADYYQSALFDNSQAFGYQRKVRRHTGATLKTLRVGYTDGRLYEHLKKKGYSDEQLIESGLVKLRKDRLQDFFLHDLFIYPHLDKKNRVAGFTIKDQRKKFNYRLPGEYWGPNCIFYNMQAFSGKEVFLVEGENDLLSVYGRGELQHVAAINGQISKVQLDYLINWAPGKTIYLCFDNDDPGRSYVAKVCRVLKKLCFYQIPWLNCLRIKLQRFGLSALMKMLTISMSTSRVKKLLQ